MAQCLLVDDRDKAASLYSLNLRVYADVDVIWKTTLKEALEVLKVYPDISLVITRAILKQEQTALKIYECVQEAKLTAPIIVIGNEPKLLGKVTFVDTAISLKPLVPVAAKLLGITAVNLAKKVLPDFYEIGLFYFKYLDTTICDVHFRTSKKHENPEYSLIIKKGGPVKVTHETALRYIEKGVTHLFIPTKSRIEFVNHFTKQILAKLGDDDLIIDDRVQASEASMRFVADEIFSGDLTDEIIQVTRASVKAMAKIAEDIVDTGIRKALQALMGRTSSYNYILAQVTVILITHALKSLPWGAKEHQEKLSFVAFFCGLLS